MYVRELRNTLCLDMAEDYDEVKITDGENTFILENCNLDNGYIEIKIVKAKVK